MPLNDSAIDILNQLDTEGTFDCTKYTDYITESKKAIEGKMKFLAASPGSRNTGR